MRDSTPRRAPIQHCIFRVPVPRDCADLLSKVYFRSASATRIGTARVSNMLFVPFSRTLALMLGLACRARPTRAAAEAGGGRSPSPSGASVYFIDVKDGSVIAPSTTIHFGLRGMGVTPAGLQRDNSGHHHLLVDTDLPPLDQPIPNDLNHLHFGAGQTEYVLDLPPGEHTLQLLLADHGHVPHAPPVVSERIRVVVRGPDTPSAAATARRHSAPRDAKVYLPGLHDGSYVSRTPLVRFGLVNMGVAPAGVVKANTGHHHLLIDTEVPPLDQPVPNDANHLHFGAGQTEARVSLPLGPHRLQLLLADENHVPHDPPVVSKPVNVIVTASGRAPRSRRSRRRR